MSHGLSIGEIQNMNTNKTLRQVECGKNLNFALLEEDKQLKCANSEQVVQLEQA
jgi:hypothetical protein